MGVFETGLAIVIHRNLGDHGHIHNKRVQTNILAKAVRWNGSHQAETTGWHETSTVRIVLTLTRSHLKISSILSYLSRANEVGGMAKGTPLA